MNRAEKTREYLKGKLEEFRGYKEIDNRDMFFDSVRLFREILITYLMNTKILKDNEISELDDSLKDIDINKTKGNFNKVYWPSTIIGFDRVILTISSIIGKLENREIPIKIMFTDFVKENIKPILLALFTAIIGGIIIPLLTC